MKKVVLVLVILILAIIACIDKVRKDQEIARSKETEISPTKIVADTDTTHLQFLGISIDGSRKEFDKKMLKRGFTKNGNFLIGTFAGRKCTIDTNTDSLLSMVVVIFDTTYTTWMGLKSDLLHFTELYSKKYGEPILIDTSFEFPYREGDGDEIQALSVGKLKIIVSWVTEKGSMIGTVGYDTRICFAYTDGINHEINQKKHKKKALNDI